MELQAIIDSFILTKILFFAVFIATAIYWISSFSKEDNIIFKLPVWHRRPYKLGLIIIMVAAFNIFIADSFQFQHLNMFLLGAVLIMAVVAYWDKRLHKYFTSSNEDNEEATDKQEKGEN